MGWTENYDDPKVKKLDKVKKLYMQALSIAARESARVKPKLAANIQSVLKFNIDETYVFSAKSNENDYDPQEEKPSTNRETMIWLKHHASSLKYCTPGGKPLQCDGIDDVNFYVLGPPTKEKGRLKKSAPSRGRKKETYLSDEVNDEYLRFAVDVIKADRRSEKNAVEDDLRLELDKQRPFADRYAFADGRENVVMNYSKARNKWRKIDDIWLDMASNLAIKLDDHTNNSSLVLAIELGDDGKVLLFPGDAQVGNWLGWGDLTWKKGNKKIRKDDLLKRTVLYKVGHHGSHNATLKKEGLEKMTHSDLIAMIPVDHEFAVEQEWEIPYSDLLERLESKCRRRVLRSDKKLPSQKPYNVSQADWKEFLKSIKRNNTRRYIELTIHR
jgi:hypothetical protein